MIYGSVCSGIEAASCAWNPLGWKAAFLSEIEPFPRAVLAHHYPETPLHGDFTTIKANDYAAIDLLVGGTPCQSFSVAGLRKGLDDPRGNLMLEFGALAQRLTPRWIVWENVPGVLSSNGGNDFRSFLDMLEELGYVCDIEILDAQYFGVAQRRRRVFVCGQHRNDLLSQRTDTSALTITQCLQEILQAILIEGCSRSGSAPENSDLPSLSKDGAIRRMRLFGLDGASECWPMLRENLIAAFQRYQQGQKHSDAPLGESEKELTQVGQLMGLQVENLSTLTEKSLKNALDEAFEVMKLFTTSTPTSPITQAQIYTCSKAALLIAKLTQLLSQSSPAFWNSALSSLTAITEYTNYARSTSSDLFGDMERVQSWSDFIGQAEPASEYFLDIGIECFGEIFPLPSCLQGHPAPSRQARQGVAGTISARTKGGGGLGSDFEMAGGTVPTLARCDTTGEGKRQDYETCTIIANSLRGEGFDASEDGTGRGTPLVPIAYAIQAGAIKENPDHGPDGVGVRSDNCSYTLEARAEVQAVAFAENSRAELRLEGGDGLRTGALSAGGGKPGQGTPMVAVGVSLRGREGGATAELGDEVGNCLRASGGGGDKAHVLAPCIGWSEELTAHHELAGTIQRGGAGGRHDGVMDSAMQVRRLTPVECERLQGFRDDYTLIPVRGKPAADGPRYKALGNSMAVPVIAWLGRRIEFVDSIPVAAKVAA